MSTRLNTALIPGTDRPVVIGEYPYYRADPANWAGNLTELRSLGVDVVSFYLPWRFHETGEGAQRAFDFHGKTDPQRDVVGLIGLAAEAGLAVLVKPGPFIHAEVQLGGLPDRLCGPGHTPYRGLNGDLLTSQAKPLPSLLDQAVKEEVATWLRAVADEVVAPTAAPRGPVVALQLGNEGMSGDVHIAIDAQDASPAAREEFARWLSARGLADEAARTGDDLADWPSGLRLLWSRWSGEAIAGLWDWISDLFPAGPSRVANVPLARATGPDATIDAWAARHRALKGSRHLIGHTEWVGNPAQSQEAFATHLGEILLGDTDVLEANWGFTWDDETFAGPRAPLFNALLALTLGSTTVSVYTACAAGTWGELIDMDPEGLRAENVDPALHAPPYCPGAPLTEAGEHNPTAESLRLLARFLELHGAALAGSRLDRDADLLVDRALVEAGAWQREGKTVLRELTEAVHEQLRDTHRLVGLGWLDEAPHPTAHDAADAPGVLRAGHPGASTAPGELTVAAGVPAHGDVGEFVARLATDDPRWTSAHRRAVALTRTGPDGTRFIGAFNPAGADDRVAGADGDWAFELPAGTAALAVSREGTLLAWLATPTAPSTAAVTLTWGGEQADALRVTAS
ncbi:beta-galactosidase [Streptomyces sp. NPDC052107]|uniref:beta-galactosidase n=1 Tax=Streptomyces sp. NPDC052107 TaxID=3155632 RepID=UPI003421E955